MIRTAIMQPYFLPYIGYYQLIAAVDKFVVYDDIEYTKKGWFNRNRMLLNGSADVFTVPLQKASDYRDVRDREISSDFDPAQLLARFRGAYKRAPHFGDGIAMTADVVGRPERNLFDFLFAGLRIMCERLAINTEIIRSSDLGVDRTLRGEDRVLATCKAIGSASYINAIGGQALYSRERFDAAGIELAFIQSELIEYPQFGATFVPSLSIVDMLMFNPIESVRDQVQSGYRLV